MLLAVLIVILVGRYGLVGFSLTLVMAVVLYMPGIVDISAVSANYACSSQIGHNDRQSGLLCLPLSGVETIILVPLPIVHTCPDLSP